jgi:MFS family permease
LSRRFVRRRGMAISVVQSANGFARAVSAPLVQLLISSVGWRHTYLVQAGFMAAMMVPLVMLFRRADTSSSVPPRPQPLASTVSAPVIVPPPSWTLAEAVRYAAEVLGTGSFLAIAGTIFTGTLSDYIGREAAAILAYGISIIGVVCALFITGPSQGWLLWLFACFFGLTWGARGPAITAKTADLFPGRQLGAILGVITIGSGIGSAAGSWAAGWIFDLSGSYELAFALSIASYVCGCVAFWALRRPPARHSGTKLRRAGD